MTRDDVDLVQIHSARQYGFGKQLAKLEVQVAYLFERGLRSRSTQREDTGSEESWDRVLDIGYKRDCDVRG